jgi:peptidylprolyl isomerase
MAGTAMGVWAAVESQSVLGKLGTTEIKYAEIQGLVDLQGPEVRKQLGASLADLDKLVRSELVRKSLIGEAKEKGWEKRPEVQALMERAKEQALVSAYVQSLVRPPQSFPSEEELKSVYEANKNSLLAPNQYQLATIFISSPEKADKATSDAAAKKVSDLAGKLQKSPGDFAKLATEHSDHKDSAAKGGELGWVSENQLMPEMRGTIGKMEKGGISAPLRERNGWHILKLLDRKPGATRSFDEVRSVLAANLRQRKMQEGERTYIENMLRASVLTVNQIELSKLQESLNK